MLAADSRSGGSALRGEQGRVWPTSQSISANGPRPAEAGGRSEPDLALAGRAGGRIGQSLWGSAFHIKSYNHASSASPAPLKRSRSSAVNWRAYDISAGSESVSSRSRSFESSSWIALRAMPTSCSTPPPPMAVIPCVVPRRSTRPGADLLGSPPARAWGGTYGCGLGRYGDSLGTYASACCRSYSK